MDINLISPRLTQMISLAAVLLFTGSGMAAEVLDPSSPARYDVVWDTPGTGSCDSMPLGNGEIGLNVWTEENGDVCFYIATTGAWGPTGELMKLARIRLRCQPALFEKGKTMRQALLLEDGSIKVSGPDGPDKREISIWVDANHPVIWIEADGAKPFTLTASVEIWRNLEQRVLRNQQKQVGFFQWNNNSKPWPSLVKGQPDPLRGRGFGGMLKGKGFVNSSNSILQSAEPAKSHLLSITVLTRQTKTMDEYIEALKSESVKSDDVNVAEARSAHAKWWREFWNRSWIHITSDNDSQNAFQISRAYALQRFMDACQGRGAYPIKFNGGIFTMDVPHMDSQTEMLATADYHMWGGQYWFQNSRHLYWPMIPAGDFEMMAPLFDMYFNAAQWRKQEYKEKFGYEAVAFAETQPFWGAQSLNMSAQSHTARYWTGGLELLALMLEYHDYTGDEALVTDRLLPLSDLYLSFYDKFFKREDGKLVIAPANALETYWDVVNPVPELAGLMWVLDGLLRLPEEKLGKERKENWTRLRAELAPLPISDKDWSKDFRPQVHPLAARPKMPNPNTKSLAAAEVIRDDKIRNSENPELYAVFPFRIYGVGKPDLDIGVETFHRRLFRQKWSCWRQEETQAALLGLPAAAREGLNFRAKNKDPRCRFPAFWAAYPDWVPDLDHGGSFMTALQKMLLHADNGKLFIFPAWPKDWDVEFKLHAPGKRTVQGVLRDNRVEKMKVEPDLGQDSVIVMDRQ
ncbi:MAG: hypothetical protein JW808_11270 [Victivallales bacterium]|nr:hypothetical protein [Victivallales bacterium]